MSAIQDNLSAGAIALPEDRLQKSLSPLNVWALALGCIIGWGAFIMPGEIFLVKAGPLGMALAMLAATVILIIIATNYYYMIKRYPVAGGEFIYVNATFGNKHAFVCSWFLALCYLSIVPLNATALALIFRTVLHDVINFQFGFHYTVAGYDVYMGEVMLALAALVLFAVLSIRGVSLTGKFQTLLVFTLVGGICLISVSALSNPQFSWANFSPGFPPNVDNHLVAILSILAISPWAFVGFDTIPQAAEEFKFSPAKSLLIMVIAIVFGSFAYVALNMITIAVFPSEFGSWVEYIAASKTASGLMTLPTFYSTHLLLGDVGLFVLSAAVIAAILSGLLGFYMATSRLIFAMSRDKVLPELFSKLHHGYKTPRNAILFILAVSVIAPFAGRTALGWIVDMASLGAAVGYGYTSLVAYKYAKQNGDTAIQITGLLGTAFAILFAVLLIVPIPYFNISLGPQSYFCLIVWIIMGAIFYNSRQKSNK